MTVSVCIRPRAYLRNYMSNLRQIFVYVTYGHGLTFLWRRFDTLCTSGSVDDALFARSDCAKLRRVLKATH